MMKTKSKHVLMYPMLVDFAGPGGVGSRYAHFFFVSLACVVAHIHKRSS